MLGAAPLPQICAVGNEQKKDHGRFRVSRSRMSFDYCDSTLHEVWKRRKEGATRQIVIVPIRQQKYRLADLLKGVAPQNRHGEAATGDAVGLEVWRTFDIP